MDGSRMGADRRYSAQGTEVNSSSSQGGKDSRPQPHLICEKESAEHLGTAAALRTIANFHRSMGAYAEAQPLLERVLAIQQKYSAEHLDTGITLNVLTILCQ